MGFVLLARFGTLEGLVGPLEDEVGFIMLLGIPQIVVQLNVKTKLVYKTN